MFGATKMSDQFILSHNAELQQTYCEPYMVWNVRILG